MWNQPPAACSKKIPGRLVLCYGLPLMIKHNFATEIGIVNGQRCTVYAWQESAGTFGQRVLDVLFVKLTDPARPVHIQQLPLNIVPIVRTSNAVQIRMPNGHSFSILRQQVEVAYDFAMTDYASQGYTRSVNPVNLFDLRTHQGYYTALSRSSTANGTVIIQGFDVRKITGGCSPALKREFRELEILDTITKHRFEGTLPLQVVGPTRRLLISQFLKAFDHNLVSLNLHTALQWSDKDPLVPIRAEEDVESWKIITDGKVTKAEQGYVIAEGSNNAGSVGLVGTNDLPKKQRWVETTQSLPISSKSGQVPLGIVWRANSCAYDSVIYILYNTWKDHFQKRSYMGDSALLNNLVTAFKRVDIGIADISYVQHQLQVSLNAIDSKRFVPGHFASVVDIVLHILSSQTAVVESRYVCPHGHQISNPRISFKEDSLFFGIEPDIRSTQDILPRPSQKTCSRCICKSNLHRTHIFSTVPSLIAMDLTSSNVGRIDNRIEITRSGVISYYKLVGLSYFGGDHFTTRFVTHAGTVWKHDGLMRNGKPSLDTTEDLRFLDGRAVVLAVYALIL